jgi:hypothetical protein
MNATEENDSCSSAYYEASAQTARMGLGEYGSLHQYYSANVLRLVGDIGRGQSADGVAGVAFFFGYRKGQSGANGDCIDERPPWPRRRPFSRGQS